MLLLDPFSHCDICLEPYTSDESAQTPHAIPCGHVFCKTCLLNVYPTNCPLCRKPFMPDRSKRLHVERPDDSDVYRHADYLKRLILTWGTSDEELALLLVDIEEWLELKTGEGADALRKARDILRRYHKIQTKKEDYHRTIRRLKDQIASGDFANASKTEAFRAQSSDFENQVQSLQSLVSKYESELVGLRPLLSRIEIYEHELKQLRQKLDYYAYPSSSARPNPLPQPPVPAAYESQRSSFTGLNPNNRLPSSNLPYPRHTSDARDGDPHTNGYTTDPSSDSNTSNKNGKGKEREPGPSYNLSTSLSHNDSSADLPRANYAGHGLSSASDGVLPGASPRRRVVPIANSKPNLPDPSPKMEPKLVSGARPDRPVPKTPAQSSLPLSGGMLDPPTAGRDYPDFHVFAGAYFTEYVAGHKAGYHFAEYTPGQVAMVVPPQNTGSTNAAVNGYGNGYDNDGEMQETTRALPDLTALKTELSNVLSTPSMRSSEMSRDGNSQVGASDMASLTSTNAGSSASALSDKSSRRHSQSFSTLYGSTQARATGLPPDDGSVTTNESTTLTRNRSLRQQPTFRNDGERSALALGLGLQMNHTGNTGPSIRPRYLPHASQPVHVGIITTVPAVNPSNQSDQLTSDDRSFRSTGTGRSAQTMDSFGTIDNTSSIRMFQTLGLRTLDSQVGAGAAPVGEDWGPFIPPLMIGPATTTATASANVDGREGTGRTRNDSGGFRVVRESDEERTPVSRFSRMLPAASNAPTTNGIGDGRSASHVPDPRGSQTVSDREGSREQGRSERRRNRRRSQAVPTTPSHAGYAAGSIEPTFEQSRSLVQYGVPASYPNSSSLLLQFPSPNPSHPQPQSEGQSQTQTESRRSRRRLSVSTVPVESQNTGTISSTARVYASSEVGYLTDAPSNHRHHTASHHHRQESREDAVAVGQNLITSPTLFNSRASTNALGLDGLEVQQIRPLQISAPTPVVSSAGFLRSYSNNHFGG